MSLVSPIGLLALLGIPVIIIIYFIRSKYVERQVGSTFIWKLSRRFQKNRLPVSKINRFLSFLSLILMVVLLALILSKPLISIPDGANEYILIIDTSMSMNVGKEKDTRFSRATSKAKEIIEEMPEGSIMSIVVGSSTPYVLIGEETDKSNLNLMIDTLECSTTSLNQTEAFNLAMTYTDKNINAKVVFITDKDYETVENLELVNVSYDDEWNASILDASFTTNEEKIIFDIDICSYSKSEEMTLSIYNDNKIVSAKKITPEVNELTTVSFELDPFEFTDLKITLNAKDNLSVDNEYHLYNSSESKKKILIAGSQTFFIESAFSSFTDAEIKTVSKMEEGTTGYDLYIFDDTLPTTLPTDGAILVINPSRSGDDYLCNYQELKLIDGGTLSVNQNVRDGTGYNLIAPKLTTSSIEVSKIIKSSPKSSSEIILKVNDYPALLAGKMENGNRIVSILFDLHDSNLPLSPSFVTLSQGIYNYLIPTISSSLCYECGTNVEISLLPQCKSISIVSPLKESYKVRVDGDYISYCFDELGTYVVKEGFDSKDDKVINIFIKVPQEECDISKKGEEAIIELSANAPERKINKTINLIPYFLIGLGVLVLFEWGLYSYENR